MAVVTFSAEGITALTFYLAVYTLANIAALALVTYFTHITGAEDVIADGSCPDITGSIYPAKGDGTIGGVDAELIADAAQRKAFEILEDIIQIAYTSEQV